MIRSIYVWLAYFSSQEFLTISGSGYKCTHRTTLTWLLLSPSLIVTEAPFNICCNTTFCSFSSWWTTRRKRCVSKRSDSHRVQQHSQTHTYYALQLSNIFREILGLETPFPARTHPRVLQQPLVRVVTVAGACCYVCIYRHNEDEKGFLRNKSKR